MKTNVYNLWISILSATMVAVFLIGILLGTQKPQDKQVSNMNPTTVDENFNSLINTASAEDYASLLEAMVKLRSEYSDTLKLFIPGKSVLGKDIPMLTMGNGEKKALVVGGIHAREHLTTKYLLRCIEDYSYALEKGDGIFGGYDLKALFEEYTVYVIPCVNVDGLSIILSQTDVKKGVYVDKLTEYKANYNGVDINRNFPLAWEKIDNGITKPYGYFFRGPSAASEPETQMLMDLCEKNAFSFMISVHVKGNCIFWGDNYNKEFNSIYKGFAEDIASVCGMYLPEPTKKASSYGGGFENWFRHQYSRPGICVELVDVECTIEPCTDENYIEFDTTVNYEKTKYILGAALSSSNL